MTILDPLAEYDYSPGYYAVFSPIPDGIKLGLLFEPQLRGRATNDYSSGHLSENCVDAFAG